MFSSKKRKLKASLLDNATVFCISGNGVVEGHNLLNIIACHLAPVSRNIRQRRFRAFSLPPSFEENDTDLKESVKLSRSARSVSEDILKLSGQRQCDKHIYIDCISGFMFNGGEKRISRKRESGKRKVKHKNAADGIKIKVASQPKMHKSLVCCRYKPEKGSSRSAISFKMDGYMLSYFIAEVKRSATFRSSFLNHWSKRGNNSGPRVGYPLLFFVAFLKEPKHEMLDLLGNKMVNSNILFRRSLEHALSWLSTLGGAFSALGDLSSSWAEEAGHVSLTQLRIAMKLGDPGIQSRCRLYAAISLLQRGYLKSCRKIVKRQYQYAISLPEGTDPRLRRMCLGVWSKLQYHWNQVAKSDKGKLKSTLDGLKYIQNNAKYWNVYNLEEGRKIASSVEDKL